MIQNQLISGFNLHTLSLALYIHSLGVMENSEFGIPTQFSPSNF